LAVPVNWLIALAPALVVVFVLLVIAEFVATFEFGSVEASLASKVAQVAVIGQLGRSAVALGIATAEQVFALVIAFVIGSSLKVDQTDQQWATRRFETFALKEKAIALTAAQVVTAVIPGQEEAKKAKKGLVRLQVQRGLHLVLLVERRCLD
jgi:hypothetical protein